MPRPNTIVNSEYREYIEEQLRAGVPYRKLATELADVGFNISHTALERYHKKYMGGQIEAGEVEQELPRLPAINLNDSNTPIRDMLENIYKRQIQIVAYKQDEYLAGNCRYPTAEVKALKTMIDLCKWENVKTGRDEAW